MKILSLLLILTIGLNSFASCVADYEADLLKKGISRAKLDKNAKITTVATFGVVGGLFGTMGVILTGPWWSFFAIGGPFGMLAAVPVGSTLLIISQVQKNNIKKKIEVLKLINQDAETINQYYQYALKKNPQLSFQDFQNSIIALNNQRAFCDGSMTHGNKKLALPKDIKKYLNSK